MRLTVCEKTSPPIKNYIEENYIAWYSRVDESTEWYPYASGLGSFTLPLICVIDPHDSGTYLDRTTGVQPVDDFYARLQSHITEYQLSVMKSGIGSGSITSDSGSINCGPSCSNANASYAPGTSVTLTAVAAEGSVFNGWSGGGCSGTTACTITMTKSRSVTASFSRTGGGNSNYLPMVKPLLLKSE